MAGPHPSHPRPARPGSPTRRAAAAAVAVVIAILVVHVVGRVAAYCSDFRADSYVYGTVAYRLAHGGVFFRDVSDVKPPGLYLLYSIGYHFLPAGRQAMIPFDTLFGLLGYWAVYLLARDIYGRRVGLLISLASAVVTNYYMAMDYTTDGFGLAEGFMIFFAASAMRMYRRGYTAAGGGAFFACGVLVGAELMIKQTALPLAVAMAVHWIGLGLARAVGPRRWLHCTAAGVLGAVVAIAPFVVMVIVQRTWRNAWQMLGPHAAAMLTRTTAMPAAWEDVLPLWVPLAWCSWAVADRMERRLRRRASTGDARVAPSPRDWTLLLTAASMEIIMLNYMPLRAYHYYIISSLPIVVLSGAFWKTLGQWRAILPARQSLASTASAVVFSLVLAGPIVTVMFPYALVRLRAYDPAADRAYFQTLLDLDIRNFGAPQDALDSSEPPAQ